MAQIKIISNPYEKTISYETCPENNGESVKLEIYNPNSELRENENSKSFLPYKIKQIIDIIIKEYYVAPEKIEIIFEGTNDEFQEVKRVCNSAEIAGKVILTQSERRLENARLILSDTKDVFGKVKPIIEKIVRDNNEVLAALDKVSGALEDIIPICVFGNYSAGKSTFINALIGCELLPNGGDPVTAKIYEIHNSDYEDVARINFVYHDEEIELLFNSGVFSIAKGNKETDMLVGLCDMLTEYMGKGLVIVVNKALEYINDYEKVDKTVIDIGSVIKVVFPFMNEGILGQSRNRFVIFDTPGSNSASNTEHSEILSKALEGFSNGIPVWISQYDSLDSNDNDDLCDKVLSIKALDKRFTMIVVNKADNASLPRDGFSEKQIKNILEYCAVEKMYAAGVFFVSSIMGLGAKTNGEFSSEDYEEVYYDQFEKYSNPEHRFYKKLYGYDIMPEQIKHELTDKSEDQSQLVYVNSGLFFIEQEIEDFASKYSAYNKCQMVYTFLNDVIDEANKRITARTVSLEKDKAKREKELEAKTQELITSLELLTAEKESELSISSSKYISVWARDNLDYTYTVEGLAQEDARHAETHEGEVDYSSLEASYENAKNIGQTHFYANLRRIFSRDIKGGIRSMIEDTQKDAERIQKNKKDRDAVRREIDKQTTDDVMGIVNESYQSRLQAAKDRITTETSRYWQNVALQLKEILVAKITESDALTTAQREKLSAIIMDFGGLEFNDDEMFIKTKFLRNYVFGLQIGDSERLNIRRLTARYNERIQRSIAEMAIDMNSICFAGFKNWLSELVSVIKLNITEINPQLRETAETIRDTEERINEFNRYKLEINKSMESIKAMMDWKMADTEEMYYGH